MGCGDVARQKRAFTDLHDPAVGYHYSLQLLLIVKKKKKDLNCLCDDIMDVQTGLFFLHTSEDLSIVRVPEILLKTKT